MNYGNREVSLEFTDKDGNEQNEVVYAASFIVSDLLHDEIPFRNELYKRVFDEVNNEIKQGNLPDEKFFLNHSDQDIAALAANLLIPKYELNDWSRVKITVNGEEDKLKVAIQHAILSMKLRWLEGKFDETNKAIKNATDAGDLEILLQSQKKLINKKSEITAMLGRIVLR